ncbi:carbohydrate ABC transporter permease [Paenibacillus endoradicis]|uniref:carbohydrate ABC transporter permease n=1 Tax=Paenibacillus endoradicis TaxID=2972487 RepID=UPI00215986AC|nr:carbohydrate ABC transporter permease [Paenibacillus endoradicis]MCR8657763.1 carbohydrate ABC transporter permease [Paenibacillus endoradicis]
MYHKTLPYRIFNIANTIFLLLIALCCILPIFHILAVSFSAKSAADGNLVSFWPVGFTTIAYEKTLNNPIFLGSIWIAVKRTILGTALTLALACLAAYPLSKEVNAFKSRNIYAWIFVFTMIFNGGLVPFYVVVQKLQLMNTFWVLIIPGAVNVWLTILLLNFFRGVPKELEEAALIDGAGHFRTLFSIYLPVSLPALATLGLFSIVFHWNSWFDGMLYINDKTDYPLATFLQTVIVQRDMSSMSFNPVEMAMLSQKTVRASQIFLGALPVMIIYPLLQRFFVKGLVLGSVKE